MRWVLASRLASRYTRSGDTEIRLDRVVSFFDEAVLFLSKAYRYCIVSFPPSRCSIYLKQMLSDAAPLCGSKMRPPLLRNRGSSVSNTEISFDLKHYFNSYPLFQRN